MLASNNIYNNTEVSISMMRRERKDTKRNDIIRYRAQRYHAANDYKWLCADVLKRWASSSWSIDNKNIIRFDLELADVTDFSVNFSLV